MGDTEGAVCLRALGQIAAGCLADLPSHFQDVELDEWVVMPNHVHAILVIHGRGTACRAPTLNVRFGRPVSGSLPTAVGTYKAAVTTLARRNHLADAVWQRNYFEHVIRDEEDLRRIREYIAHNPLSSEIDEENPGRVS